MSLERFNNLLPYCHDRIQTGGGLLKNHGHPPATHLSHGRFRHAVQILIAQPHLSGGNMAGFGQQPQQGQSGHALAAAGLTHQSKSLAPANRQPQLLNSITGALIGLQTNRQALDGQGGLVYGQIAGPGCR